MSKCWSLEKIVQEIWRLKLKGESLSYTNLLNNHCGLLRVMERRLGSRLNALIFAGIDPKEESLRRSPLEIEDLISFVYKRKSLNLPVNLSALIDCGIRYNRIVNLCGSWSRLMGICELNPDEEKILQSWDLEKILQDTLTFWQKHKNLHNRYMKKHKGGPILNAIYRKNSVVPEKSGRERMRYVVRNIGLDPENILSPPFEDWQSLYKVIKESYLFWQKHKKFYFRYLAREHPKLYGAITNSSSCVPGKTRRERMEYVVKAINLKPENILNEPRKDKWTSEELIEEIKIFLKEHPYIVPEELKIEKNRVYSAIYRSNSRVPGKYGLDRLKYVVKLSGFNPEKIVKKRSKLIHQHPGR